MEQCEIGLAAYCCQGPADAASEGTAPNSQPRDIRIVQESDAGWEWGQNRKYISERDAPKIGQPCVAQRVNGRPGTLDGRNKIFVEADTSGVKSMFDRMRDHDGSATVYFAYPGSHGPGFSSPHIFAQPASKDDYSIPSESAWTQRPVLIDQAHPSPASPNEEYRLQSESAWAQRPVLVEQAQPSPFPNEEYDLPSESAWTQRPVLTEQPHLPPLPNDEYRLQSESAWAQRPAFMEQPHPLPHNDENRLPTENAWTQPHVLREQAHVLREQPHVLREQPHVLREQTHVLKEQAHVLREQPHVLREQAHSGESASARTVRATPELANPCSGDSRETGGLKNQAPQSSMFGASSQTATRLQAVPPPTMDGAPRGYVGVTAASVRQTSPRCARTETDRYMWRVACESPRAETTWYDSPQNALKSPQNAHTTSQRAYVNDRLLNASTPAGEYRARRYSYDRWPASQLSPPWSGPGESPWSRAPRGAYRQVEPSYAWWQGPWNWSLDVENQDAVKLCSDFFKCAGAHLRSVCQYVEQLLGDAGPENAGPRDPKPPSFRFYSNEHGAYYVASPCAETAKAPKVETGKEEAEPYQCVSHMISAAGWLALYAAMLGLAGTCAASQFCHTRWQELMREKENEIAVDPKDIQ